MRSIITVECPECGGSLEIDVSRQKVISHKHKIDLENPEKDKAEMFDEVFERVKSKQQQRNDLFDIAKKSVEDSEKRLDELFGDMQKKIEEAKDADDLGEDPRNPFWD